MNYDEMIFQLKDLKMDKEKYVDPDDPDDIVKKDVIALEIALKYLEKAKNIETYERIIKLYEEKDSLYKKLLSKDADKVKDIINQRLKFAKDTERDFAFINNESPMRDANKLFMEMLEGLEKLLDG